MLVKGITDEDFVNYKVPSMFISMNTCTLKCDIENGTHDCQNSHLLKQPSVDIDIVDLVCRYLTNPITEAVVFGGLEPFDQLTDLYDFIFELRYAQENNDDVIIYTGYTEEEVAGKLEVLYQFPNIIVKFGRYRPDEKPHFDRILGVNLASDNQYAKKIS